jgi:signal transduction histidine kinase
VAPPLARLVRTTRRRLFLVTLLTTALLVVVTGFVTAFVGLAFLDADVDRALTSTATAAVTQAEGSLPTSSDDGESSDAPSSSDTFVLYLDPSARLVANPSGVTLAGLPVAAAAGQAGAAGSDLRTLALGGVRVRLLTLPIKGTEDAQGGTLTGYVQAGFVLTLHDQQAASLVSAIVLVGLFGLLGAALVTLFVTDRALVPIRRSFEAQRRFVAEASHELRTPAALIRADAEVLQREDLVTAEGRPLTEDIVAEAERLGHLVGDLLALAAADGAPLVVERRPVDLSEVVRLTVRRTEALAAERKVRMVTDAPPVAFVLGDRDRLMQLLLILVDNGLDHTPPGGEVTVTVAAGPRSVQLTVSDTGSGIPADQRERVFEPFASLPGAQRSRLGGSGLGLAIARRIATAHDATILAAASPTGGARIVTTLPAAPARPAM